MLNLRVNYPSIPREMDVFLEYCKTINPSVASRLLHVPYQALDPSGEAIVFNWLRATPEHSQLISLPSGNNALYCVLSFFRSITEHIAIEPTTFPGFKMGAASMNYQFHIIATDEEGMLPEALAEHLKTGKSKLIYLQPTIHNPTCNVMSLARRQAIAEVVRAFEDVYILEDDAYRFLHPDPPPSFLTIFPERTMHVHSMSKPFNPMLRAAYLAAPKGLLQGIENLVQLTSSGTSQLFTDFSLYLMKGELLKGIIRDKQQAAQALQEKIRQIFNGLSYKTFPSSYHIWLKADPAITEQWKEKNIDIPPGAGFSLTDNSDHIRIALGMAWDQEELLPGLQTIAGTLK
jgi:Transcriptional regulators containing a DNA-binding HTH domain and an aminotransferase domain (MocR family) and their eukaryotic orthologs